VNDAKEFVFLVPDQEGAAATGDGFGAGDSELVRHVHLPFFGNNKEVPLSREKLEAFWTENVVGLTDTLTTAQAKNEAKGFRVDEICFSIGVGAQGGLFFVAQASAQASISVTLRRGSG
jgi:hypothetical protein